MLVFLIRQEYTLSFTYRIFTQSIDEHFLTTFLSAISDTPPDSLQCASNMFSCDNGQTCLTGEVLCDGSNDCRDGTDEDTEIAQCVGKKQGITTL